MDNPLVSGAARFGSADSLGDIRDSGREARFGGIYIPGERPGSEGYICPERGPVRRIKYSRREARFGGYIFPERGDIYSPREGIVAPDWPEGTMTMTQGRIQDFLIGGEPNNLGYRERGTNK